MMSNQDIVITPAYEGERIDRALAALTGLTRSAITKAIREKRITQIQPLERLVTKNAGTVHHNEMFSLDPTAPLIGDSVPVDWKQQIIFEDDTLLVINKRAGQVVHPSAGQTINTISQLAVARDSAIAKARYDDTELSRRRAGIVHRLDKETSGVLVIAKTQPALLALQRQFKERTIRKEYTAVLCGVLAKEITVTAPLGRHPVKRQRQAVVLTGREATTTFIPQATAVIEEQAVTHVVARPLTGRTHQIRVHAAYLYHPILGDKAYATKTSSAVSEQLAVHNLFLHAARINFVHPVTGMHCSYSAPLPSYFLALLKRF